MEGIVRSFVPEKRFGFIDGKDGSSYFVHINDVINSNSLVQGQSVNFDPIPTPKGLSAKKVEAGQAPEAVYVNPHKFIMTKSDHVKGCKTVSVVVKNLWGESNDPNKARELLKSVAQKRGANAIVCMNLSKYSKNDGCSNYKYTMHRYYGHAVVVKRVEYTSDPKRISESREEIIKYQSNKVQKEIGSFKLMRPPAYVLYPLLAFFWMKTLVKVFTLLSIYISGRCLGFKRPALDNLLKKITGKSCEAL